MPLRAVRSRWSSPGWHCVRQLLLQLSPAPQDRTSPCAVAAIATMYTCTRGFLRVLSQQALIWFLRKALSPVISACVRASLPCRAEVDGRTIHIQVATTRRARRLVLVAPGAACPLLQSPLPSFYEQHLNPEKWFAWPPSVNM